MHSVATSSHSRCRCRWLPSHRPSHSCTDPNSDPQRGDRSCWIGVVREEVVLVVAGSTRVVGGGAINLDLVPKDLHHRDELLDHLDGSMDVAGARAVLKRLNDDDDEILHDTSLRGEITRIKVDGEGMGGDDEGALNTGIPTT
ncbi:hypothetical protein Droror1_Dr00024072 [Drosera rotundifolia]